MTRDLEAELKAAIEQHETDIADLQAEYDEVCEQHEAFRQEVSDAVGAYMFDPQSVTGPATMRHIHRFIIAKPDPLVEVFDATWPGIDKAMVEAFRAAIEKRGGKLTWGEG